VNEYTGNPAFWAGVIVGVLLVVACAVASIRAGLRRAANDEAVQADDAAAQVEAAGNEGTLYGGQL